MVKQMLERRKSPRQQILIFDDDLDYIEILRHILKQLSCKVVSVDNERDCFLALKESFFKILLLDNMLSCDKKGIDIISDIQVISPATRIIIITAFTNDQDKMYALNHCSGYLDKSMKDSELIYKLRSVLVEC